MNGPTRAAGVRNSSATAVLTPEDRLELASPAVPAAQPASWGLRASPAALDTFRTLALTIDRMAADTPTRSIAVLSAEAGEGRTLSAELLALTLSEVRPPVRLLEADPLPPTPERRGQRRRFPAGRRATPGAATADDQALAVARPPVNGEVPPFAVIPLARDGAPDHAAFLRDVRTALEAAVALGAFVLVDVPACRASSIGFAVAQMVDAAIYVVRPDKASLETHRDVLAQAALLDITMLGVLLNEG